jgi:predicted dehydrogenase
MEPIRTGYVGCGFIAQNVHLPNFASLPEIKLMALAEVRPQLGQAVADHYHIPKVYSSHLALAEDPEIEAVGVSAGFAQQGEMAADLLRAGKHVFMEKPMAISVVQAERILAAARDGKARLMVGYMKRYEPGNLLIRDTIRAWRTSGEKGRPLYARAHGFCGNWISGMDTSRIIKTDEPYPAAPSFDEQLPDWLPRERANSYVGYLQQYTHNINLLRFLLDTGDNVRVRAVDLDSDGMTGLVTLDLDGVRGVIESGSTAYHHWDEHTQVYFERGWVHAFAPPLLANPSQSRVEIYEGGEQHRYTYPIAQPLTAWQYREEVRVFAQCLRSGDAFPSSAEDTLTDVRLYEAIYRAFLGL